MRAFSWVPLLGLLAALAAAQDTAVDIESVVTQEEAALEEASHKTADTSPTGILQTVKDLVASAVSPSQPDSTRVEETAVGDAQLDANSVPAEEGQDDAVAQEEVVPTNPSEPEEAPTVLTNQDEEEPPVESNNNKNNNQVKLVGVYNEVVDNVLDVLTSSLNKVGPLPIELSDDVKLTALEESEPEPDPEPEPETDKETGNNSGTTRKGLKKRKKNKKNKKGEVTDAEDSDRKANKKNRKNKKKGEVTDAEDSERKNNKKNRKNKKNKKKNEMSDAEESEMKTNKKTKRNKNKGVNNEDEEEVEEEVKVRPANKGNKKENKKSNKNKRNNKRRNNKKNKKRNKSEDIEVSRDGRAMSEDEDAEGEESPVVGQARRRYPERKTKGNKNNNKKRKNSKSKKNRRNKKNKKNANKDTDAQEKESRADDGPVYPSSEELAASNAYITGLSSLRRMEDVTVEDTGRALLVNAKVRVGPMIVQLANAARTLTKSQVSTVLEADMQFKVRSKGRGRKLIKLVSVAMSGPSEISVARLDLPLQPEVVLAAQNEVLNALDVSRVGRIFRMELEKIFEEDNVVQRLKNHPLLH